MNQPPDPVPDMVDRYLRGELPADELAAFERVLREDAAARVCFRRAARLDANLRFLSEPQDQPGFVWRDEGGGAVKEAVSLRQTVSRLFPLRWLLPLAACFALIALGAWTWLSWCPVAGLSGVHGVVTVLRDGQVIPGADALALRAGDVVRTGTDAGARVVWRREATRVELQADAELRLTAVKGHKHLALLSGTLTAEVAKQQPGHPMILETRQGRVEVLGTRFELSAATDKTRVEVASGRVLLAGANQDNGYVVEACQSGEVDAEGEVEVESLPVAETIRMGLLAHWPLTEGQGAAARDVSGNGRDATIQNPAWTTNAGQAALVFTPDPKKYQSPGQRSFLRTPELRLPPAFTITLWLRMERADLVGRELQAVFINSHFRADADGFNLLIDCPAKKSVQATLPDDPSLAFRAGDGRRNTVIRSQPLAFASGSWRFITVKVSQPAGRAEILIDGQNVCERTSIAKEFNIEAPLFFGAAPGQSGLPLAGMMRDIRIYERLLDENETSHLASP